MRLALLLLVTLPLLPACDADCDDAGRINGTYAMYHQLLMTEESEAAKAEATVSENYKEVSYGLFVNGWSQWQVTWSAGAGSANIDITDSPERQGNLTGEGARPTQTYEAKVTPSADDCNAFDVEMEGTWQNAIGTEHTFGYSGKLLFLGEHLSGTFSYDDTYTDPAGIYSDGSIAGASGDVTGTASSGDNFDTGFGG